MVCFPSFQILMRNARQRKMKIIRIKAGLEKSADTVYRKNCKMHALINPFTPKISIVILFTVCCTILVMLFGEFGLGSTNNPLVDIFIYSHHLSA